MESEKQRYGYNGSFKKQAQKKNLEIKGWERDREATLSRDIQELILNPLWFIL